MLSVIVGTCNRPDALRRTLASLAAMYLPLGRRWELLVMDTGADDAAGRVAAGFTGAAPGGVHYHRVDRNNMCMAKNAALRIARGDIVAFTDDDVLVDRGWLAAFDEEFRAEPDVAMVTGRSLMAGPHIPDLSGRPSLERARYRFPTHPRPVVNGHNMAIRAAIVETVGLYDTRLGPGEPFPAEDVDFTYRVLRAGYTVLRSPKPLVFHDHDRLTEEAAEARRLAYVQGWGAVLCKHALRDAWMARLLAAEVWRLARPVADPGTRARRWRRLRALCRGVGLWALLGARGPREPAAARAGQSR
ncbi:MAG: glycosyltransferase family A protein [Armatimonadota bacterium]|nr:glycosyltransferase family A protein [Armatimonadota bacterium]MDR7454721.1 glycosyltransferase family A protein [Armatimonadota bacterium]MDR7457318.1 glycosyltransferase family A protein [Armatimonadota bacterium]MDR7496137.1 glycosyltransferase family A protein [Armatimonadota bacterium]MDR7513130.1 glycosyltransferase family A protein [Armatimonadota bacterium]